MARLTASLKSLRVASRLIEQPISEGASVELVGIRRFIQFALADIKFQFEELNKQLGVSRNTLQASQQTAIMLSNYLSALRDGIDEMEVKKEILN